MPALAAWTGVPIPQLMSMPACSRPQRYPKPEVTGPLTGQIRPAAETRPFDAAEAMLSRDAGGGVSLDRMRLLSDASSAPTASASSW